MIACADRWVRCFSFVLVFTFQPYLTSLAFRSASGFVAHGDMLRHQTFAIQLKVVSSRRAVNVLKILSPNHSRQNSPKTSPFSEGIMPKIEN